MVVGVWLGFVLGPELVKTIINIKKQHHAHFRVHSLINSVLGQPEQDFIALIAQWIACANTNKWKWCWPRKTISHFRNVLARIHRFSRKQFERFVFSFQLPQPHKFSCLSPKVVLRIVAGPKIWVKHPLIEGNNLVIFILQNVYVNFKNRSALVNFCVDISTCIKTLRLPILKSEI